MKIHKNSTESQKKIPIGIFEKKPKFQKNSKENLLKFWGNSTEISGASTDYF